MCCTEIQPHQIHIHWEPGAFYKRIKAQKKQIDYSPAQTLIIPRFVSPHIMKTKQHIKSAADFSAICWCCKWIRSLNRAVWQSPCVPCFTVSWWRWGRAVSCLITVTAELKWSVSRLLGGWQKDRGIAHFAEQITEGGRWKVLWRVMSRSRRITKM